MSHNTTDTPPAVPGRLRQAIRRDLASGGPGFVVRKSLGTVWRSYHERKYRLSPRFLTRSPDSVQLSRPVFILGTQGGGVTVLCRSLHRHPRAVYASGNSDYWTGHDEIHNRNGIFQNLPEALVHRSYHFGNVHGRLEDHPRFGYQRAWLYATDELMPTFRRTADDVDDATTKQFRDVLQRIVLAYAHDPDQCRFFDKSQLFTLQVPFIARMLRDWNPHFVVVARNPYAACGRAVAKEFGPAFGSRLGDDREACIRLATEHWTNSYRLALESEGDVPMLKVRYEDFMETPEREVRRICDFVGLDFHAEQVPAADQTFPFGSPVDHKWFPLKRDENRKYLDRLDPDLARAINERASDLIEAFGYDRIEP